MTPIVRIRSARLYNPCPDGTSLGTGLFNETIVLICDAAFNQDAEEARLNTQIGMGLGIGLGLPLVILIFYVTGLYCQWWRAGNNCFRIRESSPLVRPSMDLPSMDQPLNPMSLLSEGAYFDFSTDILSDRLKRELMILRLQKGRNLTDFVKQAQEKNAFVVASWIDHLNPGEFPTEIRLAATAPRLETA